MKAGSARTAGADLAGLNAIWGSPRRRAPGALLGTAIAVAVHVGVAAALVRVDLSALLHGDTTVEMDVQEPPPPPPEVRPEPPPPPPPPEVKHIIVHHAPAPTPPPEAPPPSRAEDPPKTESPPVFGVSLDSTVGDGPGLAVPVGNTLMTKQHKGPPAGPPPAAANADPDRLPAPVPEVYISEAAKVTHEVIAAYPPEMQRMGIEGVVTCKLYIDDEGNVRRVTVIEKAGHGFDELAKEALKKTKFSPARTSDGKAVPTNITYKYRFELPQ
jgi:periplasmic protein TonB